MKTLKNVQFDLVLEKDKDGNNIHATIAKLAKVCLNAPAKEGFTADDIRKTLKIMDILDKAVVDKDIELEDVDAEYLKGKVTGFKWGAVHTDIVKFVDAIEKI